MPNIDALVPEDNDPLHRLVNGFRRVVAYMTRISEEMDRESRKNAVYLAHVYRRTSSNGRRGIFFTFKRQGRYAAFITVLFPELANYSSESGNISQPISQASNINVNQNQSRSIFESVVYYLKMSIEAAEHFKKIALLALSASRRDIKKYPWINYLPLVSHACIISVGIIYLFPVFRLYNNDAQIKRELENVFSRALELLEQGFDVGAYNNMQQLTFSHMILLDPNYSENQELRWRYYYVLTKIFESPNFTYENESFVDFSKKALELSTTDDQRHQIIKCIINNSELRRKSDIYWYKHRKMDQEWNEQEYELEIMQAKQRHTARITPYVGRIINTSNLYNELQRNLSDQLRSVVHSLDEWKIDEAEEKFKTIKWDGYNKEAFPSMTALYYQIEIFLTLIGCRLEKHSFCGGHAYIENYNLCIEERISFARKNFEKASALIERSNPTLHEEYRGFVGYFEYASELLYGNGPIEQNPIFVPKWVMQRDVFIDKANEKLEEGKLKRTSSMPNINELENNILPRHRSFTL